jgi:hypothetical protein
VVLDGTRDGIHPPPPPGEHRLHFTLLIAHRLVETGHNLPQEDPSAFVEAVLLLHARRRA